MLTKIKNAFIRKTNLNQDTRDLVVPLTVFIFLLSLMELAKYGTYALTSLTMIITIAAISSTAMYIVQRRQS